MAVDVAKLVVESDTSDLKKGQADLHAFGSEAQKTSGKLSLLDKVLGVFSKESKLASAAAQSTNLAYAEGDIELNKLTNSLLKNATAWKNEKRAYEEAAQSVQKLAAGQQKLQKTLAAAVGGDTRGAAQANRFNSSNMLAQFQDIAVTAAMNMNPLLIALQQGTQLQYILANSNAPMKDFVAGLKSAFSGAGLLAIGLTGLAAALIQIVDWSKVGEIAVKGLTAVFDVLGMNKISNWFKDLIDSSNKAWDSIRKLTKASEDFNNEIESLADKNFLLETELLNPDQLGEKQLKEFIYTQEKYGEILRKLENERKSFTDELLSKNLSQPKYDKQYEAYMKQYNLERQSAWEKAQDYAVEKMRNDELQKSLDERNKKESESLNLLEKQIEAWNNLNTSAQQKLEDLTMKRSLIGAGTYETVYTQTLADLTRQAESQGITLTLEKSDELEKYAESTARLSDEVEKLTERYDFAKSSVKSLFSEMRQGLKEGESAWESFGNAVLNVLDKIIDKTMDLAVDIMFMGGRSYFGGNSDIGQGVFNAMGGRVGVKPTVTAANGGVFSNGIYSSPTVFQFAKGGKFGVMGEAGPEAVMPLTRGPDGSLGVRADNIGNSSPVVVNVINNSTAQAHVEQRQTSQGVELDVIIDQLVAEKMNKPGTSSNTALRAFSNQKLIAR